MMVTTIYILYCCYIYSVWYICSAVCTRHQLHLHDGNFVGSNLGGIVHVEFIDQVGEVYQEWIDHL